MCVCVFERDLCINASFAPSYALSYPQSLPQFLQTAPSTFDVRSWCSPAGLPCPLSAYCCCLPLSVSVVWLLKASFVFTWSAATKRRVCPLALTFNTQGSRSKRDLAALCERTALPCSLRCCSLSLCSSLLFCFLSVSHSVSPHIPPSSARSAVACGVEPASGWSTVDLCSCV